MTVLFKQTLQYFPCLLYTSTCIEEIWQEFPGYSQYEVRSALAKCGLTTKHIESLVKVLSGGEQAKVRLCKLINRETNVLLLDEPTNHLDVDAKDELKRALTAYKAVSYTHLDVYKRQYQRPILCPLPV